MPGGTERGQAARVVAALCALLLTGCASRPPLDSPELPTFPAGVDTSAAAAPGSVDKGVVPDDCSRLLPVTDLGALLGLPLDTVAVRTTVGVPSPSVGRTERLDCAYTGTAGGPAVGRPLLGVNAAAYSDDASAAGHWKLNTAAEDGARRPFAIGAASAVLIQRGGETLLTVLYGSGTLTFTLPARPLPGNRAPGDVLVDLALRILPKVAGAAPKPEPAPTPSRPAGPAQAAGAP
jgi:hypothetical protein